MTDETGSEALATVALRVGKSVTWRGQRYHCERIDLGARKDGSPIDIATLMGVCPKCGGTFTFTTMTPLDRTRWPRRRCDAHKAPGIKPGLKRRKSK